jgi:hypothetical protein
VPGRQTRRAVARNNSSSERQSDDGDEVGELHRGTWIVVIVVTAGGVSESKVCGVLGDVVLEFGSL